jgi:hypothetical protein
MQHQLCDTEERALANIVAIEPTRYLSWPKSKLKDFMQENVDLHSALSRHLRSTWRKRLQAPWAGENSQNVARTDPSVKFSGNIPGDMNSRHA